ncbi:AraC-type DNA-binding protein [Celeribacter baekdonensis]|uniref:AraC-type DNA-binding protein n=1 Tax=Celeribacter baekdonensis TaxID=875171 RepID=A0A1G7IKJ9_9RHOB|nr:helix-turn-helix domain-containing protein [Celeribacter baekdonensis]SDF13135.1 AraC-type DNA-binding protein [Celeribacter baekdonensis]
MPSLPIPLISSLVLGFLLLRVWINGRRHEPLVLLLALCALQGLIISLAQHYHVPGFRHIQPITATLIPPMAWVAFQTTAIRSFATSDLLNLLGPLCALVSLAVAPNGLDTLIPVLFCGYGIALLWVSLQGADAMPRMRIAAGDLPGRIWQVMGATLIASGLSDVLIVAVQILGVPGLQPWIISVYSSGIILIIGALSLSTSLETSPSDEDPEQELPLSDHDIEIVAKLETLMANQHLYLNPDLTLAHLSRKLLVPAKQVSAAINRVTGENVSRYINGARIKAAQEALAAGQNVTNAMLSCGFNTKSNFNREFLRVTGTNPRDWQAQHIGPPA